jgi:hypothetical protein
MSLSLLCLSASLIAVGALGAQRAAAPISQEQSPSPSPEIEAVKADWSARRASLSSGESQWQLETQNRSHRFGSPFAHAGSSARDVFSMRFGGGDYQMQGAGIPPIQLFEGGSWLARKRLRRRDRIAEYRVALPSRFRQTFPIAGSRRYEVFADAKREVHVWGNREEGDEHIAIVTQPGAVGRGLFNVSTGHGTPPWPVRCAILDAFRLAVHPSFVGDDAGSSAAVRMLTRRPVVDGRSCLAVEESFGDGEQGSVHRELWIDPSLGSVVMRAVSYGANDTPHGQYDFTYDRDEDGPLLPQTITLLQFDNTSMRKGTYVDPYDQIRLSRRSFVIGQTLPATERSFELPAGTWVLDETENQQYRIGPDGDRLPMSNRLSDLLSGDALDSAAASLLTWPGILVTLLVTYAMWRMCRYLFRRPKQRRLKAQDSHPTEQPAAVDRAG